MTSFPFYAGGLKAASFLKIPVDLLNLRWCDVAGRKSSPFVESREKADGERPEASAVIPDGR